jgi:hypothetical protein
MQFDRGPLEFGSVSMLTAGHSQEQTGRHFTFIASILRLFRATVVFVVVP